MKLFLILLFLWIVYIFWKYKKTTKETEIYPVGTPIEIKGVVFWHPFLFNMRFYSLNDFIHIFGFDVVF